MKPSHRAAALLLWAALYFCSGYVSHQINGPFAATGYIWLPAGVTVAAFMLARASRWLPLGLAFFAAQMLLGWVEGREAWRMLLFSLDEIGFAAVAVAVVRLTGFSTEGLAFVRGLLTAGLICSTASAAFGAGWFNLVLDVPFWATARIWAAADLVGILIVTPVLAGWSHFHAMRSGGMSRGDFLFGLAAFAALVLTTIVIFDGSGLPVLPHGIVFALTYIPLFFTAVVTLLWGGRAGSVTVAILAGFVLLNTSQGDGPFVESAAHHGRSLLEAQIYLAVAALLTLLINTLKTSREQLHEQAASRQNDMELALAASAQLIYRLDPHSGKLRWSGNLQRALGVAQAAFADLDQVLASVHPDDRARVRSRWLRESDGEARGDLRFRLQLPPGRTTTVVDMSGPLLDADESVAVIAGAWRLQEAAQAEGRNAA
ncbi:MASE1 domain-containing protein [Cupriavidus sp. TMH.W2]|uniref:MASE1 domain-containing protein n=1 Tax=Cupriavidus sp. TMH.W2 TaxID=3434465 RepID=UPI003D76B3BB